MGTWVDLSKELPGGSSSPARTTPVPFGGESDYMRMLREAQVVDHPLHKYKDKDKEKDKDKYKDKYRNKDRKVPGKMRTDTGLSTLC